MVSTRVGILQMMGIAGLIGLTGLVYYVGFANEGRRPNTSAERKSKNV